MALGEAMQHIYPRINADAARFPVEFSGLLKEVGLRLGDPRLNAASARRVAGIRDKSILRRFRRHFGKPLSRYIYERRMETAARLVYASEQPLGDIAAILGFANGRALANAIETWCGWTPAQLGIFWWENGIDYVLLRSTLSGEAAPEQAQELTAALRRAKSELERAATRRPPGSHP